MALHTDKQNLELCSANAICTGMNDPLVSADSPGQRTMEHPQHARSRIYPSSGAFTHLPVRCTITGSPALAHPSANKIFLRNLPGHCYSLPAVTLNFTVVEILVLLPNWFKNGSICSRFMNNNLTAAVHFKILEEHRFLQLPNESMENKAHRTLADDYRKAMRTKQPDWTKAKHVAPNDWNPLSISMDGFVPDDVRFEGYRQPPPIPFRDLVLGVKKVPEGVHAGDLTRALQFAVESPQELMFPDDLALILDHIGHTQVTMAHTDRLIVRHYADNKMSKDAATKSLSKNDSDDRQSTNGPNARTQHQKAPGLSQHRLEVPFLGSMMSVTQHQMFPAPTSTQYFPAFGLKGSIHIPPSFVEANVDHPVMDSPLLGHQLHDAHVNLTSDELEMEALLREYLQNDDSQLASPPASSSGAPLCPPYECLEDNQVLDGSREAPAV